MRTYHQARYDVGDEITYPAGVVMTIAEVIPYSERFGGERNIPIYVYSTKEYDFAHYVDGMEVSK